MKLSPAVLSICLASVSTTRAFDAAMLLTFDDVSPFEYVMIPNDYHELQWNNFFIENGLNAPGFLRGAVSSPNVAFNGLGNPASISSSTRFNLNSVYLTAVYVPMQQIRVEGFIGSTRTYNHTYVVSNTAPTLIAFNYMGIDRATFTILTVPGGIFAMDDLAVSPYVQDSDHDGVPDDADECPGTAPGALVNSAGCSIDQLCPCEGPWKNHGEFLQAFKAVVAQFQEEGLITGAQGKALEQEAARSLCPTQ